MLIFPNVYFIIILKTKEYLNYQFSILSYKLYNLIEINPFIVISSRFSIWFNILKFWIFSNVSLIKTNWIYVKFLLNYQTSIMFRHINCYISKILNLFFNFFKIMLLRNYLGCSTPSLKLFNFICMYYFFLS